MAAFLILVAVGPVQEFIAQARRTRDLWHGSELLSELSRGVATSLAQSGAMLIFPSSSTAQNVANKILARFDEADDVLVEAAVRKARQALFDDWKRRAATVQSRAEGLLIDNVGGLWDDQIESLLEFVAAWTEEKRDYTTTRDELEIAVAARKNVREFALWKGQREGMAKSSLDGARQTVLRAHGARAQSMALRYRIGPAEELDAVGLVKRMGGKPEQFIPLTNVALAAWVQTAASRVSQAIDDMKRIGEEKNFTKVRRESAFVTAFPYDAQVFLKDRWAPIAKEYHPLPARRGDNDAERVQRETLKANLERVGCNIFGKNGMRAPHPYVACLVADGDKMGATLDALTEYTQHQDFSKYLAEFAEKAKTVVETECRGSLVYSGGDDVLAFVCLPDALRCAQRLSEEFSSLMATALGKLEVNTPTPTLSVGIGVGHVLEAMGHLLMIGRDAEKLAKGSALPNKENRRNALAIKIDKRSGGELTFRCKWQDKPLEQLETAVTLLDADRLPTGKVYEVRASIRRMLQPSTMKRKLTEAGHNEPFRKAIEDEANALRPALEAEVRRILGRAGGDDQGVEPEKVGMNLSALKYLDLYRSIDAWVNLMLIAKVFSEANRVLTPKRRG